MKNIYKRIFAVCLAIAMCLGLCAVVNNAVSSEYVAVEAVDYYSSITAKSGNELLGQVHDLITKTHREYTSYSDCKNSSMVVKTDKGSSSKYVMDFYTQTDMSSSWGSGKIGTWNREHVWCQSLSNGMWGENGAGSDMHHIRPTESGLNSTRGSNKFGKVNGGSAAYLKDINGTKKHIGGYRGGGTFEPLDNVKGDVARIVMYVYTHYNTYENVYGTTNGNGNGGYFGTLKFTNIVSASSESKAIEMLINWSAQDPVDSIETARNEAVYTIQGNRNPFIDHPEYAKAIWGGGSTDDPVDPPIVKLESITLNKTSLDMYKGDTYKLVASPTPSSLRLNANWTSSNPSVASVNLDGTVTAVGNGTATITVTSKDDTSIKATATVNVYEKGTDNKPDELKVNAFKDAVVSLQNAKSIDEQFIAISKAITSFNGLSDVDKTAVTNEVEALYSAIDDYNKMIDSYNKDAVDNEQVAIKGFTVNNQADNSGFTTFG